MMKMRTKTTTLPPATTNRGGGESGGHEWEMRPGGMLVQKRNPDSDRVGAPPPVIRVRVKYGSVYHEINISSEATFGELKKMLSGPTGLHHQDQKILYKDKERDSKAFLDISGVKDKSKMVLIEDPISQEKRLLEMRKNAKSEKASKAISDISLEVDRLAGRVSALETVINKGGKVAEKDVIHLIELLMNELLNLDGIMADGDVKLQRKIQVRRVQKYVETLDMLKIKNSMPNGNGVQTQQQRYSSGQRLATIQEHPDRLGRQTTAFQQQKPTESLMDLPIHHNHNHNHNNREKIQEQLQRNSTSGPVVVTTEWETFDCSPLNPSSATSASSAAKNHTTTPRFSWEFFD